MHYLNKRPSRLRRAIALVAAVALSASLTLDAIAITQSEVNETKSKLQELQAQQSEYASQASSIKSQLADLEDQENAAVAELLLYQQQAEILESQIDNTQAIIDDYQEQIEETQAIIDDYQVQIDETQALIDDLTVQIAETELELIAAEEEEAEYYELFCARTRAMEEGGSTSYWAVLFSATSFADLLDRITFINEVTAYDNQVMDKLEAARQKVADTKARLEEEKAAEEVAKAQLEVEKAAQEEAKAELEVEKAAQEEALAELEDQQAQVQEAYNQISATLEIIRANQDTYADQLSELSSLTAALEDDIVENTALYEEQLAKLKAQIAAEEAAKKAAEEAAAAAAAAASSSSSSSDSSSSSSDSSSSSSSTTTSSSSSSSTLGSQIASYACQFIGNPYVWGGTSLTNGCDCSGFVMSVYAHFGYSLPHSSLSMRSLGTAVSYSDAQPGDLICYYSSSSPSGGHVGIYIGNGMMVNAASASTGIIISSVNTSRSGFTVRRIIS